MPTLKKRRKKRNTYYPDMCFAMILPLIMACNLYGFKAFILFAVSVLSAIVFDYIGCRIIKQPFRVKNCHSVFIGGLLALMLPAWAPWWLPIIGTGFAILLVKTPFGGVQSSPFSCTAAGFAFMSVCRPDLVFNYPALTQGEALVSGVSIAQSLSQGTPVVTAVDLISAFIGSVPGPMGATSAVIMMGILVYVVFKRPKSFVNSLSFIIVCFIGAVILTAVNSDNFFTENSFRVICLRMCSGFTLFTAVFFVTEDPLSPKKNIRRIIYGATMGIIYIALNQVSAYEDAGCFAVLITNAVWPVAEKYIFSKKVKTEVTAVEKPEITS